jgi:hypothetical protein
VSAVNVAVFADKVTVPRHLLILAVGRAPSQALRFFGKRFPIEKETPPLDTGAGPEGGAFPNASVLGRGI